MRSAEHIAEDLKKSLNNYHDFIQGKIFDRIPISERGDDLWLKVLYQLSELNERIESDTIIKSQRSGLAMARDVIAVEFELEDIKTEIQRVWALVHKLQYPPNNDIKIVEFKDVPTPKEDSRRNIEKEFAYDLIRLFSSSAPYILITNGKDIDGKYNDKIFSLSDVTYVIDSTLNFPGNRTTSPK